jgi:serine/alanine adding enzyme
MIDIKISINWNESLNSVFSEIQKDIYFTEEYVKLYETENDKAECFIYKNGNNTFIFPYLKRRHIINGEEYFDFESQYGYGGPISNSINEEFNDSAQASFLKYCNDNRIFAGFIRLHPLLDNYKIFSKIARIQLNRKTVAINLNLSKENIWSKQIHSKNRNEIRKAEKAGLIYKVDSDFDYLEDFKRLYEDTMRKVNADEFYFFNSDYYEIFIKKFKKKAFLGLVLLDNKVISAAIFMMDGYYAHYHLSGSDSNYLNICPNNFLLYNTALYLKERGLKLFHLGGGYNTDSENSLYKFKKRFSKDIYDFYTGKILVNKTIYDRIVNNWSIKWPLKAKELDNIFLKYRF